MELEIEKHRVIAYLKPADLRLLADLCNGLDGDFMREHNASHRETMGAAFEAAELCQQFMPEPADGNQAGPAAAA